MLVSNSNSPLSNLSSIEFKFGDIPMLYSSLFKDVGYNGTASPAADENTMFNEHNKRREHHSVPLLTWDTQLAR